MDSIPPSWRKKENHSKTVYNNCYDICYIAIEIRMRMSKVFSTITYKYARMHERANK